MPAVSYYCTPFCPRAWRYAINATICLSDTSPLTPWSFNLDAIPSACVFAEIPASDISLSEYGTPSFLKRDIVFPKLLKLIFDEINQGYAGIIDSFMTDLGFSMCM